MMHMHVHEDEHPNLLPYFIVSVLLHILLIALVPYQVVPPSWKEKVVEIIPISEKQKPYEIADIDRPAVEKEPKKARFAGMYNSSVDQETVSVSRSQKAKQRSEEKIQKTEDRGQKTEGAKEKPDAMTVGKKRSLYDVDRKLFAAKTPDIAEKKGFEVGGSAALQDYYPDYKIGAKTYLNVLRYPDVEYFVRMKRQFKMTFNPVPPLREHFSTNRVTRGSVEVVLAVSVDPDGNLKELFVLNGSGISPYDKEAMRTIRASSPFASPPKKFLENDGLLRMSWTFTVYL
jgi:TonB family protein